jgi:hypothetical protein
MYSRSHLDNHRTLTVALGALCLLAVPAANAQVGLGLSPMRMELKLNPGATRAGSLTLANESKQEARFRTEILDLSLDQEAVPQFELDIPSESQYSCRQWFTVNPMEATVGPQSQLLARYTLRVPANVPVRTYHCAVGFTSLPPIRKPQEQGFGVNAAVRVIATFYVTIGDPQPDGVVKDIRIEKLPAPSTALRAIFGVENSGLTNLRGIGKVEVLDSTGKVIETAEFPTPVILPKRVQYLPLVLKSKFADGDYTIRARVNIGTGEVQEATLAFRPPPATAQLAAQ